MSLVENVIYLTLIFQLCVSLAHQDKMTANALNSRMQRVIILPGEPLGGYFCVLCRTYTECTGYNVTSIRNV